MKAGATDYLLKNNLARIGPAIEAALERESARGERRQAEVALRILAETRPELRPSGAPVYRRRAPVVRGPVELPVLGLGES